MAYNLSEREDGYRRVLHDLLSDAKQAVNDGEVDEVEYYNDELSFVLRYIERLQGLDRLKATDEYREAKKFVDTY